MAGWNDLPVELKEVIVKQLGYEKRVKVGNKLSRAFRALLALSQTERTAYLACRSFLWIVSAGKRCICAS